MVFQRKIFICPEHLWPYGPSFLLQTKVAIACHLSAYFADPKNGGIGSYGYLLLTNHSPCEWLWIEAWAKANFCNVLMSLNLAIAPSRL